MTLHVQLTEWKCITVSIHVLKQVKRHKRRKNVKMDDVFKIETVWVGLKRNW